MALIYLQGNEKVLEIVTNICRNSLIISNILSVSNNLVILEPDENIVKQLYINNYFKNIKLDLIHSY